MGRYSLHKAVRAGKRTCGPEVQEVEEEVEAEAEAEEGKILKLSLAGKFPSCCLDKPGF